MLTVCVYRGVFAQLTQGGKCFLMGLADPFDHLLRVRRQDVDLHLHLPLLLLLLLRPVVSYHWGVTERRIYLGGSPVHIEHYRLKGEEVLSTL